MSIVFEPTKSKDVFVGREDERQIFAQMLQGARPEWVIHIPGPGGSGKTRLVEMLARDAGKGEKILLNREPVDFYNATNQTSFGLLQEVAHKFNADLFQNFFAEREHYTHMLETEPETTQRLESEKRVIDAFFQDYEVLLRAGNRIVWLLDTCEEMHRVEPFVLKELLPRIGALEEQLCRDETQDSEAPICRKTVFVLAGRKKLEFPESLGGQVLDWELMPLSLEQVQDFFEQGGLTGISEAQMKPLYERTGGRPLYVALSFDWLKNEVGTWEELLSIQEAFGEKLVEWVKRLELKEQNAILYTALAWRRVEPSLLGRLLQIDEKEASGIIARLSRFSFVKYRHPAGKFAGAFQLHDEMRSLINHYIWPQEGQITQNLLLVQIVNWYENRIDNQDLLEGKKLPSQGRLPEDETRALLAEWLYYLCRLDLERAFVVHEALFRSAVHFLDLEFCDLINQEMLRFSKDFSLDQRDTLRFREALASFRREKYDYASMIWHSLARRDDLQPGLKATALMLLVELDSYTGKPEEALEHAQAAEETYQKLLATEKDQARRTLIENELGQLYNNWGYAYRVKANYEKALEYYEKAIQQGGREKNVARTFNNMGYIYFLKGDLVKARTYVGRALQTRRKLNIPYELGLGYNTMGYILEQSGRVDDATDSYEKAKDAFELARSERGIALVLLNMGRIERTTNDFEESEDYLLKAKAVFEQKKDKDYLLSVVNELGCTYRQMHRWEEAEQMLRQSLQLSEELGVKFAQADNWEDLSIMYERMSAEARRQGEVDAAGKYARESRLAAERLIALAGEQGITYLLAKSERTLGDLDYGEKNYEPAFDHYFEACRFMAKARKEGRHSPVLSQRRYEEMVDRLQEQLQALQTPADTMQYSQYLLEKLHRLSEEEQDLLPSLKEFIEASLEVARITSARGD